MDRVTDDLNIYSEDWNRLIDDVSGVNRDGEFSVFPGIEYRCVRGDTVVLFNWEPEFDEIAKSEWAYIRDVWRALSGKDYLTIPHFHNNGRLPDGEWFDCPEEGVEPVLEIFSSHGSYERADALEHHIPDMKARRPDRYGVWFLQQGRKYGFSANSDGHKGPAGTNGLTAVFASDLSRDSILDAYRRRRVYGTTNARIRLVFSANGTLMGGTAEPDNRKEFLIDIAWSSPVWFE